MSERIAVIGLGYVGLPVTIGLARAFEHVTGFDIDKSRIDALCGGRDATGEVDAEALATSRAVLTADPQALDGHTFFIVTVPTPVDAARRPDFGPLRRACATIGPWLRPGAVVVFESTVYPGATEEVCGPALVAASGLARSSFSLGYSPERINPGDATHRFESIVKVVAGEDAATRARVAAVYRAAVPAGVFEAASIRVAEAAKVIENTQRDVNIALMNELSLIFDRLGIPTRDVLAAARTKWNFLGFTPGLVGGHCIGVDPYYLTAKAEEVGYHPQIILSGRRINDEMGRFVGQKVLKMLVEAGIDLVRARVGMLGITFKANVPDLRNSRAPDIAAEMAGFGVQVAVADPRADPAAARAEFGVDLVAEATLTGLDALILAVPHREYSEHSAAVVARVRPGGVLVDVMAALDPQAVRPDLRYWCL